MAGNSILGCGDPLGNSRPISLGFIPKGVDLTRIFSCRTTFSFIHLFIQKRRSVEKSFKLFSSYIYDYFYLFSTFCYLEIFYVLLTSPERPQIISNYSAVFEKNLVCVVLLYSPGLSPLKLASYSFSCPAVQEHPLDFCLVIIYFHSRFFYILLSETAL